MRSLIFILVILLFGKISGFSQVPTWAWAKKSGGNSSDYGTSIATDTLGNVYSTGFFSSDSIYFGSTLLNNFGVGNIFIVKHDALGNVVWTKRFGNVGFDGSFGITTDFKGNVYLTGFFTSPSIAFGLITLTNNGGYDNFTVKFDPSGNTIWAKKFGGSNDEIGYGIATDSAENVFITGSFNSPTIFFGSSTLLNPNSTSDVFIAKYDSLGNEIWAKSAGGIDNDASQSIAVNSLGEIGVTGYFSSSSIVFGSITLYNSIPGYGEIFIVKYDNNGNTLWAKSVSKFAGGLGEDKGKGICFNNNGDIWITGSFYSPSISFDTLALNNSDSLGLTKDIFIAKLNSSGNILFAKSEGGAAESDYGNAIAVDENDNAYVTGTFASSQLKFGLITLINRGAYDIYVAKFDSNCNEIWAVDVGAIGEEGGRGIAKSIDGSVYIIGDFYSFYITFNSQSITNSGSNDIFIAKLNNVTGIEENISHSENTFLYPNPTNGSINIKSISTIKDLKITNLAGQLLVHLKPNDNEVNYQFDNDGIYFVQIENSTSVETKKVIVSK